MILPTTDNFEVRGVHVDMCCCVCREQVEYVFHLLFVCVFSRRVWNRICLWVRPSVDENADFGEFWEKMFIKVKQANELELFCVSLWMIWNNKNKTFHKNVKGIPQLLADKARIMMDTFSSTWSRGEHHECNPLVLFGYHLHFRLLKSTLMQLLIMYFVCPVLGWLFGILVEGS